MNTADRTFVSQLQAGIMPQTRFHHREHVRLAFLLIVEHGMGTAADVVFDTIRYFGAVHGHADKFHATLSTIWPRLVAAHMQAGDCDFDIFAERETALLDKQIPLRFYSKDRLMSPVARERFVEPDRADLPRIPSWCLRSPQ